MREEREDEPAVKPVRERAPRLVLDAGSQAITAGTNYTLVIAPPLAPATTPRAFLVPGC